MQLAQRRSARQECSQPYVPDHADLPPDLALAEGQTLVRGTGCRSCRSTGYRGRLGVYEVLKMTDDLRQKVMERVNAHRIAAAAEKSGDLFRLRQDGFAKALAGVTTIDEVAAALAT